MITFAIQIGINSVRVAGRKPTRWIEGPARDHELNRLDALDHPNGPPEPVAQVRVPPTGHRISNQQSAISNQQSAISNQQSDDIPTCHSDALLAGSQSTADAPALRSRRQSTPITALITSGSPRNVRKFQLARENVRRSPTAFTVAVRVPPSSNAISPTASPGPNSARCTPCAITSAVPSKMRKNRPALSPSATTSAPAPKDISFPASQILFSCFCGRSPNNSEVCNAAMISLAIRLTF